jgi:hypothetical protein
MSGFDPEIDEFDSHLKIGMEEKLPGLVIDARSNGTVQRDANHGTASANPSINNQFKCTWLIE